jgi:hypothetical protein
VKREKEGETPIDVSKATVRICQNKGGKDVSKQHGRIAISAHAIVTYCAPCFAPRFAASAASAASTNPGSLPLNTTTTTGIHTMTVDLEVVAVSVAVS